MEEYRKQYKFYKKHVPPTASTLFEESSRELNQIRKDVLVTHRIAALTDLLMHPKKENLIKYSFSKKFKPRVFVLDPKFMTMQSNLNPFLVQQATSLFNNIYYNTSNIVDSLLLYTKAIPSFDSFSLKTFIENIKNPPQRSPTKRSMTLAASSSQNSLKEFNFLALSAIPSLFGFFSSNEHINLSMPFFVKIITSTECFPLITAVLTPFFSAPCLYRFFESSLTPFFDTFIRDTQKFTKNVIQEYGTQLTAHFSSKTELIPHTHVVLLRMMFAKFGEIATSNFFSESILKPQVIQWKASISSKIPKELDLSETGKSKSKVKDPDQISSEIIMLIFESIDSASILQSVLKSESLIEPPFQYTVFEDPFLYFLTSINDLRLLYHLFIRTVSNPDSYSSMKIIDTEDVDENAVFFFKTYPSHQLKTQLTRQPLIFPNYTVKLPKDERKERQWRAVENLADEKEVSTMSIVKALIRKTKSKDDSHNENQKNYQTITVTNPNISAKEIQNFADYALIASLKNLTDSADVFEQFLIQMNDLSQSKEWLEISLLHEHAALLPIAKEIALKKEKKYGTDMFKSHSNFLVVFEKASARIHSTSILRYQYLFTVQRFIKKLIGEFDKDFEKVKEKLADIFQRNIESLDSLNTNLNQTRSAIFWEAVEFLRTAQCDDLPYQFTNLMRSLDLLYNLGMNTRMNFNYNMFVEIDEHEADSFDGSLDDETGTVKRFLKLALSLSFSYDIFYLYMVLSLFAMSNETFRSFCSEHEQRLWVIFQNVMLNMTADEELSQIYTGITSRITP